MMINPLQRIEAIRYQVGRRADEMGVSEAMKKHVQNAATAYYTHHKDTAFRAIVKGEKLLRGLQ